MALDIKKKTEQVGIGTMVLSVDSTTRSPRIVITGTSVDIASVNPGIGINVSDNGVTIQGTTSFLSSGVGVTKGNYSENDKSSKPFTYTETVFVESAAKEVAYNQLAAQGVDTSLFNKTGGIPIITDIGGYPPHMHTITHFKHVHAVDPAYLYKMSPMLKGFLEILTSFISFLGA